VADGLQSQDPSVRIDAIVAAAKAKDRQAVPLLVDRLSDSEEDVRFFAGIAIERITGETMGWHCYDPPARREAAIERWREWLKEGPGPAGRKASPAATRPATPQPATTQEALTRKERERNGQ
jgi:hypothetical protein